MSATTTSTPGDGAIIDTPPQLANEKLKSGTLGPSLTKAGLGLGVLFLLVSLVLGAAQGDHWKRFFYSFLTAWSWAVSIVVGALFFVILHHLVRAQWSTVVRRLAEGITSAFPVLFIAGLGFVIPVLAGYKDLYYWTADDARNAVFNHHLHGKLGFLSPGAFGLRYVIYFAIFIGLSRFFTKWSRKQDETGEFKISEKLRVASGPGIILYALTTMLFAFDVLMSLAPKWYSTIFSVNFFGGAMIGFYAFVTLLCLGIQRTGRMQRSITTEHYHDLGKWLFAFTFFWAYTSFSQFMLYWYANIPEETTFYKYRMFSDWSVVTIAVGIGHWAFPFVFLMSRWTKRILPLLAAFAAWQLVFHWLDLYWNVMPNYQWGISEHAGKLFNSGPLMGDPAIHRVGFSPVDITTLIAFAGLLVGAAGLGLRGNLVPVRDPKLAQCLGHENY